MEPFSEDSPFHGFQISYHDPLRRIDSRHVCGECKKSSRYFCYRCIRLSPDLKREDLPTVDLPLSLLVVKDKRELEGKSTAIHVKILAPEMTSICLYDKNNLETGGLDAAQFDQCVILYPSEDSRPVDQVDWREVKRIVVLDGTWQQAKSMCLTCPILSRIPKVHLCQENKTVFWRYQQLGPHCLSTIEAIHCFFREYVSRRNLVCPSLDNLLYFYSFYYHLIQQDYKENPERRFTHRHSESQNYIKYK